MRTTNTEHELSRLEDRLGHETETRRRRFAAAAVAAAVVLAGALAAGAVVLQRSNDSLPADREAPTAPTLDLADVEAADAPVAVRELAPDAAPVFLDGVEELGGLGTDPDGTLWLVSGDGNGLSWTLNRVPAGTSTVDLQVPFAAAEIPTGTSTGDTNVLALVRGSPDASAGFAERRDGLLFLDADTGSVLAFTPVEKATDVDAATDGTVWAVVAPDKVAQFDPRTGRQLRALTPPGLVDRLYVLDGSLWVYYQAGAPSVAHQIDSRSGRVMRTVTTPERSIHLRLAGGVVVLHADGRATRVEPDGSATAVRLALPQVFDDVVGSDGVDAWLASGSALVRLDGKTLIVEGAVNLPWPGPYQLARRGSEVIVHDPTSGTLRQIEDSAFRAE